MKILIQGVFMKMTVKMTVLALMLSAGSIFANSFEVKVGSSNAVVADKWGFDAGIGLNFSVNEFFTVGVETGLQWITWDRKTGKTYTLPSGQTAEEKIDLDIYNIPVMFNPRFMMPMGGDGMGGGAAFIPYLTVGVGYSAAMYSAVYPDSLKNAYPTIIKDTTETLSGLIVQPMLGVLIPIGGGGDFGGADTGMKIMVEVGYRYNEVEKDAFKADMSGLIVRAGTNFAF